MNTAMTEDGKYYQLEPTLSLDHGPNYKEKIYNKVRLGYAKDPRSSRFLNYAETKCVVDIPKMVSIKKLKRKKKKVTVEANEDLNQSVDGDVYSRSSKSRGGMSAKSKKESARSRKATPKGAKSLKNLLNIQDQADGK